MFKYLQRYSFLEGNSYLKKAINQETKTTNSGWIANLKYIIDSYGLSNLMINILKVVEGDKVRKTANHKFFIINIISFKKEIKTAFFRKTSSPALPERRIFSHKLKTNIKWKLISALKSMIIGLQLLN